MPKKALSVLCLTVAFLFVALMSQLSLSGEPVQAASPLASADVHIGHMSDHGLQFTLSSPKPAQNQSTQWEITGLNGRTQEPGAPDLPIYTTFIALPPGAEVIVSVTPAQVTETAVAPLSPVPAFDLSLPEGAFDLLDPALAPLLNAQMRQPIYRQDSAIYSQNAFYPAALYTLSPPMYYGDLRLVKLTLHPLRYNPVTAQLSHAAELSVSLSFIGGDVQAGEAGNGRHARALNSLILNYAQAQNWHHLPPATAEVAQTVLPVGQQTFKITLDQDGIYEISGADLESLGIDLSAINPNTLEMSHRGQPVAFQLIHNGDNVFDASDKIRFYGAAFRGTRAEKRFVGDRNVYWLWPNGTPTYMLTATNELEQGYPVITTFPESITLDSPKRYYYTTLTNLWHLYPNEPENWYMDWIVKTGSNVVTRNYTINLPHPAPDGPDAQILAEVTAFRNQIDYVGRVSINSYPGYGEATFPPLWNVNITTTVPITALQHMANQIRYASLTNATLQEIVLINRFTVDYTRQMIALNNQLIFNAPDAGSHEFHIANFSSDQALVWDVTDPLLPVAIDMSQAISNTGGVYLYQVGRTHGDQAKFIATTLANLRQPLSITPYTPPSLDPPAPGAEWLAISHANFLPAAQQLANHRAQPDFGGLTTHVVDIADVVNQYGYGLAMPEAIRAYLAYAYYSWSPRPAYVTFFGDATSNPLNHICLGCQAGFDPNEPTYLLTDLVFKDRYQGMVPSDHTFAMLVGEDILPDIATGRIAVQTVEQAESVVEKIIQYEQIQREPATWGGEAKITFAADNADAGGDFCLENQFVAAALPAVFEIAQHCIVDPATDTELVRLAMQPSVTNRMSILNYRGHGSMVRWAANPDLLNTTMVDFWINFNLPIVVLSADCLDGTFTYPGIEGLGETFLQLVTDPALGSRGTAAHWSSTGLGTTFEHTVLVNAFYDGVFQRGYTAVGDAATHAKIVYYLAGYHESELYSFTLQGDPAMQLFRPDLNLTLDVLPVAALPGEEVVFTLQVGNQALYPDYPTLTAVLPEGLDLLEITADRQITYTYDNQSRLITIDMLSSLSQGESATITIATIVAEDAAAGTRLFQPTAHSAGLDLNPVDNTAEISLNVFFEVFYSYLPLTLRN